MQKLVYAADDEFNIRNLIKMFLENAGYSVEVFESGEALLEAFMVKPSDLVLLDITMPGRDGFQICAEIRKISTIPIIMLTARNSEVDYITGLTLGSDDYFTKPFSPMTLVMRIQAIFRRIEMESGNKKQMQALSFCDIILNPHKKSVHIKDKPLELTPTEFDLLQYLMQHKERAIGREELLNKVWGYDNTVETRVTDDTIKRIRRKLTDSGSATLVETVWGFGFKLSSKEAAP